MLRDVLKPMRGTAGLDYDEEDMFQRLATIARSSGDPYMGPTGRWCRLRFHIKDMVRTGRHEDVAQQKPARCSDCYCYGAWCPC